MAYREMESENDLWHEATSDHPLWRESYYFDFYDPRTDLACFSSIGYRPNKGHMGSVVALVWDGHVYVRKDYGHPTENEAVQVDGLLYEPETLHQRWGVRFLGTINQFDLESEAMRLDPDEFPVEHQPHFTLTLDLEFDAIHEPMYYQPSEGSRDVVSRMYTGHADQAGRVTGTVTIGDTTVAVDGLGERDHSWGIRDWRDPDAWQWTAALFDADTAVNFWRITNERGTAVDGYLHLHGESRPVESVDVETEFREDGVTQDSFWFTVVDEAGRAFDVRGDATTVVPVDFRYEDEVTSIRRTPTRFQSDATETSGYGWTEYASTESAS